MTATQTDPFVPLPVAPTVARECQDFRVMVLESAQNARPFHGAETPASTAPAPSPSSAPPRPGCEPRVSLQREGDRVTGIHIQCSCGQIIDLACVYP